MIILGDSKIEDLLLKLLEEMAIVKSKLETLDDLKLDSKSINSRVDHLEAQNREHDKSIKSIENRCNTVEKFLRDGMVDSKKQQSSVWISMGLAVFGAVLSVIMNLF